GRRLLGAVEETSPEEVRDVFDTNVFGLLTVTRAVLPVMRSQRTGRVLNISSVGGFSSTAGWGVYCATKFAVEGLSEALRTELAPLGISVTVVEPGTSRTDFRDASPLQRVARPIDDRSHGWRDSRLGRRCEPRAAGGPGQGGRGHDPRGHQRGPAVAR